MLAVAAYFQASGMGELVATSIRGSEGPPPPPIKAFSRSGAADRVDADAILGRNPFDSKTGSLLGNDDPVEEDPEGEDEDEEMTLAGEEGDPKCTFGSVRLIIASTDPAFSFASIEDKGGESKLRRVGDPVDDHKVSAVAWDRVWLSDSGGKRCQLEVGDENKAKPAAKAGKPARTPRGRVPPKVPDSISSKINKVSDTEFNIERSVVDEIIAQQAQLMRYTKIRPVRDGDTTRGLRVSRLRDGTLLNVLGLRNGDEIQTINGFQLTDPQKALEAYGRLRTAQKLSLQITRGGKSETIEYNIQ